MDIKEYSNAVEKIASRHGFSVYDGQLRMHKDFDKCYTYATIHEEHEWGDDCVFIKATLNASIRKMGGQPSVEELLRASDEIRKSAELMREFNEANLSYVVKLRE